MNKLFKSFPKTTNKFGVQLEIQKYSTFNVHLDDKSNLYSYPIKNKEIQEKFKNYSEVKLKSLK
jgi:hypothetical protein